MNTLRIEASDVDPGAVIITISLDVGTSLHVVLKGQRLCHVGNVLAHMISVAQGDLVTAHQKKGP